jgi:demethylmenaquinone methyltransferase/2-methoxy-6-polyprenyl-1,4-benzoquinol methylase
MKDTAVKKMFETIARDYDFQNSFLSLGIDIHWRRVLARLLCLPGEAQVVDVAVGTGEVAVAICRHHRTARVAGIDFSPSMLKVAREKVSRRGLDGRICLAAGDGRLLPVASGAADAITISFGIRNIQEKDAVLSEFHRILKPGGQLLIMEFSFPETPLIGPLYRFYFEHILPPVGNFISGTDYAYSYLAESVHDFPEDEIFLEMMAAAGFGNLEVRKLTFGIAKIFIGYKGRANSNLSDRSDLSDNND